MVPFLPGFMASISPRASPSASRSSSSCSTEPRLTASKRTLGPSITAGIPTNLKFSRLTLTTEPCRWAWVDDVVALAFEPESAPAVAQAPAANMAAAAKNRRPRSRCPLLTEMLGRSTLHRRSGRPKVVFDQRPGLPDTHDVGGVGEHAEIGQRVGGDRHQIGVVALGQHPAVRRL